MQTQINADMAVGIPGEFATTRPRYSYAIQTGAAVTFGEPVGIDGNVAKPVGASVAFKGVAGTPHQHVQFVLPNDTHTLTVGAGATIDLIERGEVFIKIPTGVTGVVAGDKLAVDSTTYTWKKAVLTGETPDTPVGTFLKSGTAGDIVPVRIGF